MEYVDSVSGSCSVALHNSVRYAYDVGQGLGCPSLPQLAQIPAASLGLVKGLVCTCCTIC